MTDTSTGTRPFGLSLDPLEGESLTGFVLRLAHRLHVSPLELARLTGLTEQDRLGRARASLSTLLTPAQIHRFAATARLAPGEVRAMTLEPFASRYPPAARSLESVRAGKVYSMHTDGWLFATTARYCPHCLAGDGSDIQTTHGGPWQILWRLPVVFACPLQGVPGTPLSPLPQTGQLQQQGTAVPSSRRHRSPPRRLPVLPHPGDPHQPARRPLRGTAHARLTAPSSARTCSARAPAQDPSIPPPRAADTAGAAVLHRAHPVRRLVMISWPRIQAVGTTRQLAAAVGRHLAIHEGADSRSYRSTAAPIDALACAGVLQVTDRILTAGDLREALTSLAPEENRNRSGIPPTRHLIWDKTFKQQRSACSERFQLAAETIVPTFRRTGKGGLRLPSAGVGLRPEHVPACLPQALAERHPGFLSDIAPKMRRRTASVFLVRRARGSSLDEAAHFLGISTPDKRIGYTQLLNRHLRTTGTARDFERALDAITAELLAGPVIDYQHRREALATWTLEPENWQHMLTQLPDLTHHREPISDDRRRLAVSAYIWARVTEGEPDFAPCPPHIAQDPQLRVAWTRERHNVFHWLRKADHQPYYGALKPLLEGHAKHLAKAISNSPQHRQ